MQINYIAGTNFGSAPSWLTTVLGEVSAFYDKLFTNNITLNITVNWVPLAGDALASNSLNGGSGVIESFSTVSAALAARAQYATQSGAYANMPTGVGSVYVAPGEAEVLGLTTGSAVSIDLNVGSTASWIPDGGYFDPFGAIAHEITETAMGRIGEPDSTPTVMDMFRFSAAGVHDLTAGTTTSNATAYFSVDGGSTNLGTWNNAAGQEDYGDWVVSNFPVSGDPNGDPVDNDAYGVQEGGVTPVSEVDIELMNVLGWSTDIVTSGDTLSVQGGQTSSGYTVMAGGQVLIESGGTASNFTYANAQQFNDGVLAPGSSGGLTAVGFVQSSGSEVSAAVGAGGFEWVDLGGDAAFTDVTAGGTLIDFGYVRNALIAADGLMNVQSGGFGNIDSVYSGGTVSVFADGITYGDKVKSGATEIVLGSAQLATIAAGATEVVSLGGQDDEGFIDGAQDVYGLASGDVVSGVPANQYVEAGGSAVVTVLEATGFEYVSSGGAANATTVSALAEQVVDSGGYASATVVLSGGGAVLEAGAVGDALTVLSGGYLHGPGVLIDDSAVAGTVSGVTVGESGHAGRLEVLIGAVASNLAVSVGADIVLGSAAGTRVSRAASENVSSAGQTTSTLVLSGGAQAVFFSGTADATVVSAGGYQLVSSGGVASGTAVLSGGRQYLSAGGLAFAADVSAGGAQVVFAAGSANGTLLAGGEEVVSAGGVAIGTTVSSAGRVGVSAGGASLDATVSSGGTLYVLASGTTTATTVVAGGDEIVSSGGVASQTAVLSGGLEYILLGAVAVGAMVSSGGVQYVRASGAAIGAEVSAGGYQRVSSGGVASGATLLSGGRQFVSLGGESVAASISGGGAEVVLASGAASLTVVGGGGEALVSSGGVAVQATLSSGGKLVVTDGRALATTVTSGGALYLLAGGRTTGTLMDVGGDQLVSSGGVAVSATVLSAGREFVLSGGEDLATLVSSGGVEVISAGGAAFGLVVLAGGVLADDGEVRIGGAGSLAGRLSGSGAIVETEAGVLRLSDAGAGFSGRAVISGGVIELASAGALGAGSVQFLEPATGSAVLQIDAADAPEAGGSFANTLSNFNGVNEAIDLGGVAYVAGASAAIAGSTLVLTDGGQTYRFDLAGATATTYAVTSDGHGGTLIAATAADPGVVRFAQAAAAFAPTEASRAALVSSASPLGGTAFLHATVSAAARHP